MGSTKYVTVLRRRQARMPFVSSLAGRLPLAMVPVALVVAMSAVYGSYTSGGVASGGFALGTAVGGPLLGRALDRWGQAVVVAVSTVVTSAFLVLTVTAIVQHVPYQVVVGLVFAAGATYPPLGPAMRSCWPSVLDDEPLVRAGYALDASGVSALFIVGPLLVSLSLAAGPVDVPLWVAAGLLVVAGLTYARDPAVRRLRGAPRPHPGDGGRVADTTHRRFLIPLGAVLVMPVMGLTAAALGTLDTSLVALAKDVLGQPSSVGLMFTASSLSSIAVGLLYGSKVQTPARERALLPVSMLTLSLGVAALAAVTQAGMANLIVVLGVLLVVGAGIAPAILACHNLVGQLTIRKNANEAQAWLVGMFTAGNALGAGSAGVLLDSGGVAAALTVAAGVAAVGAVIALLLRPRWAAEHRARLAEPPGHDGSAPTDGPGADAPASVGARHP